MEREKNLELLLTRYPELEVLREELYRAEAPLRLRRAISSWSAATAAAPRTASTWSGSS